MKQITVMLIMFLLCKEGIAQVNFSNYYHDDAYIFDDDLKVMRSDLFTTYKSQFNLGMDDEMELKDEGEIILDGNGDVRTMARYIQKYKGYPVEGKMMNVTSKCGVVFIFNAL